MESLSCEDTREVCAACGAPLSPDAASCERCKVALTKPEPSRVAREIALYVVAFIFVALLFVSIIWLRRIFFFAVIFQVALPFAVLFYLAYVVVRFWKR